MLRRLLEYTFVLLPAYQFAVSYVIGDYEKKVFLLKNELDSNTRYKEERGVEQYVHLSYGGTGMYQVSEKNARVELERLDNRMSVMKLLSPCHFVYSFMGYIFSGFQLS